jgi:hypothetical protein
MNWKRDWAKAVALTLNNVWLDESTAVYRRIDRLRRSHRATR